ncbi:hypothetical protein [Peribacillus sp. CSMR9]|uniref:hypothetical protein n=1 Tax=Peribacillus sp. CSMR9 TaxID=2981350 RepID=UPI0029532B5E|nr:hypothetical protein [Peribacillus sp. CSMR9]MDV7767764.1 hypothetical protein [Peribacillus sp. CSMR9]
MIHFLLNIVTDIGKDVIVAVATSLIISAFSKKKNHSALQDGNGSSSDSSD